MKRRKNTLMWISIACFIITLAVGAAYKLTGHAVDAQVYLHEAFGLITVAWLFFFLGMAAGLIHLILRITQHFRKLIP